VDNAFWYSGEPDSYGKGKEACVGLHPVDSVAKLADFSGISDAAYVVCELTKQDQFCLLQTK